MKPKVKYTDLGLSDYKKTWDLQSNTLKKLVDCKRSKISGEAKPQLHQFFMCEHRPVITLGRNGSMTNLIATEKLLANKKIEFYKINRGGDMTFHGPGQITGYPIFDLDEFFTDIHRFVRSIEEAIIRTIRVFDIEAIRYPGYTGVWIPDSVGNSVRKICSIGIHLSRWVTMHGFALNVNTNLEYFKHIIPCGIPLDGFSMTSMAKESGSSVDIGLVKETLKYHFAEVFHFEYVI